MNKLYYFPAEERKLENVVNDLKRHPEIKFVSLVAVDLGNNHTDERIPMEIFMDNPEKFIATGVQTDGSSVNLPKIAEINNAKVDLIPDTDVKWYIDYNYEFIDEETGRPVGTLIIPALLKHDDKFVDSRSILKAAKKSFEKNVFEFIDSSDAIKKEYNISSIDEIEEVSLTIATELEFWVKTPDDKADIEKLSTSQELKEQYWKRTVGPVRTAMEESLLLLNKYGYKAEMGHKEVGGVTSKVTTNHTFTHIMEQLEIDWEYANEIESADHELFAKDFIKDCFNRHGLDVSFLAKPIEGVAGSGEHHHIGAGIKLKNGKFVNIFSPRDMADSYLSRLGFGALMGILKNYEVINPFVTSTNDAFNRLKPGFEAPVCTVTSLGHSVDIPSRNRTILIGLIRDLTNPYATRFELRAPNPYSNTYLVVAALCQAMLDGMKAVVAKDADYDMLVKELSKDPGVEGFYLEKDRQYRSEENVFEFFSEEDRNKVFGKPPKTVWENAKAFSKFKDKTEVLKVDGIFTDKIIESYKTDIRRSWIMELENRLISNNIEIVRDCDKLHDSDFVTDYDIVNWEKVNTCRYYLMKDSLREKSLFTKIREAIEENNYDAVSELQIEMNTKVSELINLYAVYKRNLF